MVIDRNNHWNTIPMKSVAIQPGCTSVLNLNLIRAHAFGTQTFQPKSQAAAATAL